ncbi:hypothetical protein AJ79_04544 [Helicocarpus griseus UAMH5409]|uniref:Uncharacterized protein n=1 Tax=Helicocarpus griseus UAMH5409 TaxID=1447875 RepID=A0A2B7XSW1_9EURO|nr:hypothetical protein AJ79_04544 [Helicocarpus griseus UAMH5409]
MGIKGHSSTTINQRFQTFITHTLPDINPYDTRIIAICGATDESNNASPAADGWIFSDFFLFHTLLHGQTAPALQRQYWFSSEHPRSLWEKYGEYTSGPAGIIHAGAGGGGNGNGNGACNRIVLNENLLRDELGDINAFMPRKGMLGEFRRVLVKLCEEARRQMQDVLLCLFGYGEEVGGVVRIGDERVRVRELIGEVVGFVDVTAVVTAGIAGGWVVWRATCTREKVESGLLTPKSDVGEGDAGDSDACLAMACGSIFFADNITALTSMRAPNVATMPGPVFDEEEAMEGLDTDEFGVCRDPYEELSDRSYKLLLYRGDIFGKNRGIHFGSVRDEWEMFVGKRRGIPLSAYEGKWKTLDIDPPLFVTLKPNPRFGDTLETVPEYPKYMINCGIDEHLIRFRRSVTELAHTFMESLGPTVACPENWLHRECRALIYGHQNFTTCQLEHLQRALELRVSFVAWANQLVLEAGLPIPDGLYCYQWNVGCLGKYNQDDVKQMTRIYQRLTPLFPLPEEMQEDRRWIMPQWYLAASFVECNKGLGKADVERIIWELEECSFSTNSISAAEILGFSESAVVGLLV